jgi:poly-gamma-glutamate synthesis protein (capsule biosynthesis protein)
VGRRGSGRRAWQLPVVFLAALLIVVLGGFAVLSLTRPAPAASPRPSGLANASQNPQASPAGTGSGTPGAEATPGSGSPRPSFTGGPVGAVQMPVVPVVGFWSTETGMTTAELAAAFQGADATGRKAVLVADDADAIAAALGVSLADSVQRAGNAEKARKAVSNGAIGLLLANDVDPSVRALSLDGKALFGEDRIADIAEWPLNASIAAPLDRAWNPSTTWTLLAGGDMFMDRGVYRAVVKQAKGVDWPFDGGTARVTGHHCCGEYVTIYEIPDVEFTGNEGAVRALVKNADLAIANLETPVPDNWVYHAHDYIFSSDPGLLPMLTNAGIDFVSLANNHIGDFSGQGVVESRRNVEAAGLKSAGAGENLKEAGEIAYLEARGTRVAIIACQGVQPSYYATKNRPGALPCSVGDVVSRIEEAAKTADLVVVFPHWGVEYDNDPQPGMRNLAQAWIEAGAGLIVGAHSHVPGAIEEIGGSVVFYSLGNFIFDQSFRTSTMESALPEMTFQGSRLVQIRLHPYVSPGEQPNLLDPATDDGKVIMDTIRSVSEKVGLKW